jgi:hypothetical protein
MTVGFGNVESGRDPMRLYVVALSLSAGSGAFVREVEADSLEEAREKVEKAYQHSYAGLPHVEWVEPLQSLHRGRIR